jgi:hypothetical protein
LTFLASLHLFDQVYQNKHPINTGNNNKINTGTMHLHTTIFAAVPFLLFNYATAATLNDFTPRQSDLTGDCKAIYTSQIAGCTASDFQNQKCSATCISALMSVGASVRKSCQGQAQSGTIIAAFLNSQGTNKLCPNANSADLSNPSIVAAAAAAAATPSMSIGSSVMVLSATSYSAGSIIVDTASAKQSTTTTQPAGDAGVTSTITGTSLAFATSTPSSVVAATGTTLSKSATHATQHTATPSNGSGGSPFDASSAACSTAVPYFKLLGTLVLLLFLS